MAAKSNTQATTPAKRHCAEKAVHSLADMLAAIGSLPDPVRTSAQPLVILAPEPDMSPAVIEAVHACLRTLAGAGDLGRDAAFITAQAGKQELLPGAARTCRKLLDRHRHLLPPGLAAMAMGEVDPEPIAIALSEPVAIEPEAPAVRRGRGRPPKGGVALTPAERNRAWRAAKAMVAIEIPGHLAERLRAARDGRGMSTADLLTAAMDALDRQDQVRPAA